MSSHCGSNDSFPSGFARCCAAIVMFWLCVLTLSLRASRWNIICCSAYLSALGSMIWSGVKDALKDREPGSKADGLQQEPGPLTQHGNLARSEGANQLIVRSHLGFRTTIFHATTRCYRGSRQRRHRFEPGGPIVPPEPATSATTPDDPSEPQSRLDVRGQRRSNATNASARDPDARLCQKSSGAGAMLCLSADRIRKWSGYKPKKHVIRGIKCPAIDFPDDGIEGEPYGADRANRLYRGWRPRSSWFDPTALPRITRRLTPGAGMDRHAVRILPGCGVPATRAGAEAEELRHP